MASSITVRYFLFPPDGGVRRLSLRIVQALVQGTDRMPRYAGQRLRVASADVYLENGQPQRLGRVTGRWWEFDETGSIQESSLEALRDALNSIGDDAPLPEQSRAAVTVFGRISRRRYHQRWSWKPTPADITAIVHAIWPETAGREVDPPRYERGVSKRRYSVSYKSERIFRDFHEPVWKLGHLIEDLSEHDLKGILTQIEDEVRPAGEGTEHLWRGIGEFVEWTLKLRKARRSPRGTWYATAIQLTPMHDSPNRNVWDSAVLEERRCQNRPAAEAAGREMLKKYADRFAYNSTIEVEVYPEIEWSSGRDDGDVERSAPAANDERAAPEPGPV